MFLCTQWRKTHQEITFSVLMPFLNMAINGIIRPCVCVCVFGGGVYRSKAVEKQGELGGNAEGGDKRPRDMQMG